MNCLQCGFDMKMEISSNSSETKSTKSTYLSNRSGNYICPKCDVGYHVTMYNIWELGNNLVLIKGGGLKVARDI